MSSNPLPRWKFWPRGRCILPVHDEVVEVHWPDHVEHAGQQSTCSDGTGYRYISFSDQQLQESTIRLNTYTGEAIQVLGKLAVKVSHGDQEADLWVQVVAGEGPDLVGRDWSSGLHYTIFMPLEEPHSEVTTKEMFSEDLGCLQGTEVKLCTCRSHCLAQVFHTYKA